eukprot:jgi/Mesvir1/21573/Mv04013-RA.1
MMGADRNTKDQFSDTNLVAAERYLMRFRRKFSIPDEAWNDFSNAVKVMAGVDQEPVKPAKDCEPRWRLVNLCYASAANSFRLFGEKAHYSLIFHTVVHQFDRVKHYNVHAAPETKRHDIDWCAAVDDRAHFIVTGMTKEEFRKLHPQLASDEPVKYAYNGTTCDLHDYVLRVLFALQDHCRPSEIDHAVFVAHEQWSVIARRFGCRLLCRHPRTRSQIEYVKRLDEASRLRHLYWSGISKVDAAEEMEDDIYEQMWTDGIF